MPTTLLFSGVVASSLHPQHLDVSIPPSLREVWAGLESPFKLCISLKGQALVVMQSGPSSLFPAGWGALHSHNAPLHSGMGEATGSQWFFLSMGRGRTFLSPLLFCVLQCFLPGTHIAFICRIQVIYLKWGRELKLSCDALSYFPFPSMTSCLLLPL